MSKRTKSRRNHEVISSDSNDEIQNDNPGQVSNNFSLKYFQAVKTIFCISYSVIIKARMN